jgi:hypothetical protein
MQLSIRALAVASGLLWGGAILLVGLINLAGVHYGTAFLQMISSIYPGFHASRSLGDVLTGTVYGLVDGALGGLFLAWLYNIVVGRQPKV